MRQPHVSFAERARHWDSAYATHGVRGVSWCQPQPRLSLELVDALRIPRDRPVIDVGAGSSTLAYGLLERGFSDVTVLDVSAIALAESRRQWGDDPRVHHLHEDLTRWQPTRRYALWHDRAAFHFLVAVEDRDAYLHALLSAILPGGFLILATFAPDGPKACSGLPVVGYSPEALTRLLGETFEPLETRHEVHTTPGGSKQPFTWLAGCFRPE